MPAPERNTEKFGRTAAFLLASIIVAGIIIAVGMVIAWALVALYGLLFG